MLARQYATRKQFNSNRLSTYEDLAFFLLSVYVRVDGGFSF